MGFRISKQGYVSRLWPPLYNQRSGNKPSFTKIDQVNQDLSFDMDM